MRGYCVFLDGIFVFCVQVLWEHVWQRRVPESFLPIKHDARGTAWLSHRHCEGIIMHVSTAGIFGVNACPANYVHVSTAEPPSKGHLQELRALWQPCKNPENLLSGAWALLGNNWLNLALASQAWLLLLFIASTAMYTKHKCGTCLSWFEFYKYRNMYWLLNIY